MLSQEHITANTRFSFGSNWTNFLLVLNEQRISEAEESLNSMLKLNSLANMRFLDVGSGSGLFSLAARRLGAEVVSLGVGGTWPAICNIQQNVTVTPLLASQSQGILTLETHAEPTRTVIEWVNNTGDTNDYFTVEKADNKTGIFESLEIVNNKSVDKDMTHYVTYDNAPTEGDNSYRIAVIHNDGSTKVSDIKIVQFKGLYSVRLFPNPVNDVLTLDLSNYKNQNVEVYLYNYFGHLQLVRKIDKVTDALFDISVSDIQTGNYKVRIQSKKRRAVTQSVIIAH